MYSCFFQTGQYIIPYHTVLLTSNGQKDRLGNLENLVMTTSCIELIDIDHHIHSLVLILTVSLVAVSVRAMLHR